MTEGRDYRKYLEQRFEDLTTLVNAQFINVHERLDDIHNQVKKINGRVGDVEKEIVDLQINDKLHVQDCPAMPIITEVKKDVEELKIEALTLWIKKHWKLSILITVIILYFAYSLFTLLSIEEIIKLVK